MGPTLDMLRLYICSVYNQYEERNTQPKLCEKTDDRMGLTVRVEICELGQVGGELLGEVSAGVVQVAG